MDFDAALYDLPINEVAIALQAHDPLVNPDAHWVTATAAVKRLVEEDLLIKPERCAYANGPRTVICENDAPIGKTWCYVHGN